MNEIEILNDIEKRLKNKQEVSQKDLRLLQEAYIVFGVNK